MDGSELIGISRIVIPSGKISLLSQTPILRCSTSLDLLTRVLNYGRLRAHRDIADRDSKRQDFFALANPDSPICSIVGLPVGTFPGGARSLPRVLPYGRSRSLRDFETFDVPTLTASGTPISRCRMSRLSTDFGHLSP
jgi:hypothetical protein